MSEAKCADDATPLRKRQYPGRPKIINPEGMTDDELYIYHRDRIVAARLAGLTGAELHKDEVKAWKNSKKFARIIVRRRQKIEAEEKGAAG